MAQLESRIKLTLAGSDRSLVWSDTQDVIDWATGEHAAWAIDTTGWQREIAGAWSFNAGQIESLMQHASSYAQMQLSLEQAQEGTHQRETLERSLKETHKVLAGVAHRLGSGEVITREHPTGARIAALAVERPKAAALLLATTTERGKRALSQSRNTEEYQSMLLEAAFGAAAPVAERENGERSELQAAKTQWDTMREEIRATLTAAVDEETGRGERYAAELKAWEELRKNEGRENAALREACTKEWTALKAVYDTELSSEAPKKYWAERATAYAKQAGAYAVLFVAAMLGATWLFVSEGLPYLHEAAGMDNASTAVALVPIVIPAFIAVWVLRILGRLLAESLHLSRDARERETMVLTFLALVRSEEGKQAKITEESRAIVLAQLFRPAATVHSDDAPPVNVLEYLKRNGR